MSKWSLITHMTNYMARPRLGNQKAPTQWPSEATATMVNEWGEEYVIGKCRRAAYFRYLLDAFEFYKEKYGFYQPFVENLQMQKAAPEPYVRWLWKQGDLYEQYCIDTAKESGVFVGEQVQVYIPEFNVSGKIDIIVLDPIEENLRIVEVKSIYGYNANTILGTPSERRKGQLGVPRDSYLMQLGIYQYWYANPNENFGKALLIAGARDTGRYAEFEIDVKKDEESESDDHFVFYKGNAPFETKEVNSGISIENILSQYKLVADAVDSGSVPDRDYELQYSEEKIDKLYERNQLNKTDRTQYEKRKLQLEEGKSRVVKAVEKGDWQCRLCSFRDVCYEQDGTVKDL